MQFLIDTHVLIWYLDGNYRLPDYIRKTIDNVDNKVFISIASLWELAIKLNLKKIDTTINLSTIEADIIKRDFTILNISFAHLNTLSFLQYHHGDPFDRLLIAQAITENLSIISADRHFAAYLAPLIWQ